MMCTGVVVCSGGLLGKSADRYRERSYPRQVDVCRLHSLIFRVGGTCAGGQARGIVSAGLLPRVHAYASSP
jgi:hypothetical protein